MGSSCGSLPWTAERSATGSLGSEREGSSEANQWLLVKEKDLGRVFGPMLSGCRGLGGRGEGVASSQAGKIREITEAV